MLQDIYNRVPTRVGSHGLPLFYDHGRSKWLSLNREIVAFSLKHRNVKGGTWLKHNLIPSNLNGFKVIRNATVTSISLHTANVYSNINIQIRKNNAISIYTLSSTSNQGVIVEDLDIDLDEDDWLQAYVSTGSNLQYPILSIELAWRD